MTAVDRRVCVLGPVRATRDGHEVKLRGRTARTVLARLALAGGRAVSVDELTDALWGDDPPIGATSNLQSIVSRLRSTLGRESIVSAGAGYRLDTTLVDVDLADAEAAIAAVDTVSSDDLVEFIDSVLAEWDGEALADVAWTSPFEPERARLAELKMRLTEERYGALLANGRALDVLADLERDATADPQRESLQLLHMEALHECGRTAEALRVGSRYRRALLEASGIDASPAVAELERSLLASDPHPGAEPVATKPAEGHRSVDWAPPSTPFVGRSQEVDRLGELLASERLVTVLGTGGVGKTRLAMELVADGGVDVDDVVVVSLGALDVGAPIVGAVAAAMGLESIEGDLTARVQDRTGGRRTLLVLDNCEHVIGPIRSLLPGLLAAAPRLRALATSRRPLGLADEQVFPLAPLPVPVEPDRDSPALALYLDRMRRAAPNVEAGAGRVALVTDICRLLEGLPLALELAAVRAGTLGLDELRSQLAAGVQALRGTRSEGRSSTIDSMVDWSLSLLTEPARQLFDELCVFPGTFDIAGIEFVSSLDEPMAELAELVESSLVSVDTGATPVVYRLLQPIREVGRQRASRDRRIRAERAHADWVAEIGDDIRTRWMADDRQGAQELLMRRRVDLRSTLSRVPVGSMSSDVDRLAEQLVWPLQEHPDVELIDQIRRHVGDTPDGWLARAALGWWSGNPVESVEYGDRLVALDGRGPRAPLAEWAKVPALTYLGEFTRAAETAARVVEHPTTPPPIAALAAAAWALAELYGGDRTAALEVLDQHSDVLERSAGGGFVDYVRAQVTVVDDVEGALALLDRGLREATRTRSLFQARLLDVGRLALLVRLDRTEDAARVALELVPRLLDAGIVPQAWLALHHVAELLVGAGHRSEAAAILEGTGAGDSADAGAPRAAEGVELRVADLARPDLDQARGRTMINELWQPARAALLEVLEPIGA